MAIAVRTISTPARNTNQITGGSSDYTITSTTAGDLLIGVLAWFNSEGAVPTSISGGGTWAEATVHNLDANSHIAIWYAPNVSASVTTLSVTFNGDGSPNASFQITVIHCSGAATSSPLDVAPTSTTGTSAAPSITSGTLAQADEIIVQVSSHTGADLVDPNAMVEDTGDGYTQANENLDNDSGQTFHAQYKVVTATTSNVVDTSFNASRTWAAILASFKGAAGPIEIAIPAGVLNLVGRLIEPLAVDPTSNDARIVFRKA